MRILLLYIATLAFAVSALGQDQIPDSIDASRYYPLEVGNMWEYEHVIDIPIDPQNSETRFERYTVADSVLSDTADFLILYEEFSDALEPIQVLTVPIAMDSSFSIVGNNLPGLLDLLDQLDADFYSPYSGGWLAVMPGVVGPDAVFDSTTITKRFETFSYVLEVASDIGVVGAGPFCEPCGALTPTRNYHLRFASVSGHVVGARVASTSSVIAPPINSLLVYPNPTSTLLNIKTSPNGAIRLYNIQGRLVRRFTADPSGFVTTDIKNLSSGVYVVKSTDDAALVILQ